MSTPSDASASISFLLDRRTPNAVSVDPWDGPTGCQTSAYLESAPLPEGCAAAARGVVLRHGHRSSSPEVLMLGTEHGPLVIPGGGCEPGETLEETLRREILEEAGWTVTDAQPIGFIHLRRLGMWTPGQPYPFQDFVFAVYVTEAVELRPEAVKANAREQFLGATFTPFEEVRSLSLTWPPRLHQRLFLNAAVRARSQL